MSLRPAAFAVLLTLTLALIVLIYLWPDPEAELAEGRKAEVVNQAAEQIQRAREFFQMTLPTPQGMDVQPYEAAKAAMKVRCQAAQDVLEEIVKEHPDTERMDAQIRQINPCAWVRLIGIIQEYRTCLSLSRRDVAFCEPAQWATRYGFGGITCLGRYAALMVLRARLVEHLAAEDFAGRWLSYPPEVRAFMQRMDRAISSGQPEDCPDLPDTLLGPEEGQADLPKCTEEDRGVPDMDASLVVTLCRLAAAASEVPPTDELELTLYFFLKALASGDTRDFAAQGEVSGEALIRAARGEKVDCRNVMDQQVEDLCF